MSRADVMHHDDVAGIPVFWSSGGGERLTASVRFRTGIADMSLPTVGWTRLAAETVLRFAEGPDVTIHGSLTALWTSFTIDGTPQAVCAALERLTACLRAAGDGGARMADKVIAAAEQGPRPGAFALAMRWMFGARGFGLMGFPQFGLATAHPEAVWDLAVRRFTRGNAALCLDGPPPPNLLLDLPPGTVTPLPDPAPRTAPGAYAADSPDVLGVAVVPDAPATHQFLRALRTRVERALPGDSWHSYPATVHTERLGRDLLAGVSVTAPGTYAVHAVQALLEAVHDLDGHDLPGTDVATPDAALARAWSAADKHFLGEAPRAEAANDDGSVATAFREGLFLGVPADADLVALPVTLPGVVHDAPVEGDTYLRRFGHGDGTDAITIIGDEGLSQVDNLYQLTITWGEVAGMLVGDGDARVLVRGDGRAVDIDPALWSRGGDITAHLDRHVPGGSRIPWPMDTDGAQEGETAARIAHEARWPRSLASHLLFNGGLIGAAVVVLLLAIRMNAVITGGSGVAHWMVDFVLGAAAFVTCVHAVLSLWGLIDYLRRGAQRRARRRRG